MAYYITGDCHGIFERIIWFHHFNQKLTKDDVIILLGDVGLNYYGGERDLDNKELLNDIPCYFFCVHGNHEARASSIASYKEKQWRDGVVYYEPEYPRILFPKDGEIYDFDGKKAIVIGGAYSVDKEYRLNVGIPWFSDEQPSDEIKVHVEHKLGEIDWRVNYVFSHTCPLKYEPTDMFLSFIDQTKVDKSTEEWLSKIANRLDYEHWYFGHYHDNREYTDATLLYEEIQELGKRGGTTANWASKV